MSLWPFAQGHHFLGLLVPVAPRAGGIAFLRCLFLWPLAQVALPFEPSGSCGPSRRWHHVLSFVVPVASRAGCATFRAFLFLWPLAQVAQPFELCCSCGSSRRWHHLLSLLVTVAPRAGDAAISAVLVLVALPFVPSLFLWSLAQVAPPSKPSCCCGLSRRWRLHIIMLYMLCVVCV